MNMKRNSDFYKKPALAIFAILAAVALYFIIAKSNIGPIEGLATAGDIKPASVADEDPDLKCPASGSGADPTKCTTADLMKLAYDLAADPRTSVMELDAISKVCSKRKFAGYENFYFTALALRAATLYNTTANEKEFTKILEGMTKGEKKKCFDNDFMKSIKGLLVGSKDEPTLTVAQSEAVRCYAHRFNAFNKCLKSCK